MLTCMYWFFLWEMSVDPAGLHIFSCFNYLKLVTFPHQIDVVAADLQKALFLVTNLGEYEVSF